MKRETIKKLIAVVGCATLFCAVNVGISAAATSDSAVTTGEVIAAASISKTADLSFGKIVAGAGATKVTVAPSDGARTKDTGDAQLAGGTVTAAAFSVSGQAGNTYTVTLPASFTVTDGSHTMTVDAITPDGALTGLSGNVTIKVGATLNVTGGQSAGVYTSATGLTATVAYQ